jgi:hypothetical protein
MEQNTHRPTHTYTFGMVISYAYIFVNTGKWALYDTHTHIYIYSTYISVGPDGPLFGSPDTDKL